MDKLTRYIEGKQELPGEYLALPVYGAGLENVGDEKGNPIYVPMNEIGPDELLVRHDADSICFSDIKVIRQGQSHPRIYQDMATDPVVLGHELTMTIVKVGDHLKDQYHPGERFTIQADIYENGISYAYGYYYQGAMSQYGVIDQRILCSDGGNNNLLPLKKSTGYAEGALAEPWACVVAAYDLSYRNSFKKNGVLWVIGTADERPFNINQEFLKQSPPKEVWATNVSGHVMEIFDRIGLPVKVVESIESVPDESVDDIVLLGYDADILMAASQKLTKFGIFCVMTNHMISQKVSIDLGRVHYQRWLYIASSGAEIADAYSHGLQRNTLKPGGKVLFAGAGGPIGRMHVQRAIEFENPPKLIVCTDVSDLRLNDLKETYQAQAEENGIEIVFSNPAQQQEYLHLIDSVLNDGGFDDVIVLAPVPPLIEEVTGYAAKDGLVNVFAGIARGTSVKLDFNRIVFDHVRYIGHSGSGLGDMQLTLGKIESGELNAKRTVAAIGSLHYGRDGLQAVQEAKYPGKVVIFNHIKEFPVTPLSEFEKVLPSVAALFDHGEWTNEAEKEFLRLMLAE